MSKNGGNTLENKNSKLKGFTLIELIIVLAIFSALMVLIMSFIDPVSRQMTDTSVRERTAAYADNISDYIDGSLRHAKFIKIYEKGYCANNLTDPIDDPGQTTYYENTMGIDGCNEAAGRDARWLAVRDFADSYFDGAIKGFTSSGGTTIAVPMGGKIHVLEVLNNDTMLFNPVTCAYDIDGKAGEIYETVYNFTAGNSVIDNTSSESIKPRIFSEDNCFQSVVTVSKNPVSVINPEHFQNYSYYYKLGMYSLEPVSDSDLQVDPANNQFIPVGETDPLPIDPYANYYYSQLQPLSIASLSDPDTVNENRFTLNVVSYQKNDTSSNMFNVTQNDPAGGTKVVPVFKSPTCLNSTSMAFINVIEPSKTETTNKRNYTYYRLKQQNKETTSVVGSGKYLDKDGHDAAVQDAVVEKIEIYDTPFSHKVSQAHTGDNIYIIYAVPSEIDDVT